MEILGRQRRKGTGNSVQGLERKDDLGRGETVWTQGLSREDEGRGRVCAGGGLPESRVRGVGVGLGRVEVGGPVPQRGVSLGTEGLNPQSFNVSPATSGFAGGSNGKESACQYRKYGFHPWV